MRDKNNGNPWALLPIGVFLIIFLGAGILSGDFYTMPAIVAFLIALAVAFCQNRRVIFQKKLAIISRGIGEENIVTMCLIFLAAGAFSGTISAAGGVESTVNLGLSIMPPSIAVTGLFIIGCFISVSMGTSVGTITAMAPIGIGIAQETGLRTAICLGAVVCGAMFGDNLSMISDTTIAAVRTQGCEMKDKFKENFIIVLPAAIITALIFFFVARAETASLVLDKSAYEYEIVRVIPYLVVLVGALAGINVFLILIAGTVLSAVVGVATGAFAFGELFQKMGEGSHQHVRYHRDLHHCCGDRGSGEGIRRNPVYPQCDQEEDQRRERRRVRNLSSGLSGGLLYRQQYGSNRYGRSNRQRDQR